MDTLQLLRPRDLCERLRVSRSSLYEMVRRGDLPRPSKLGRSSVWRVEDISAALDKLLGGVQ
jgi:predicted DNA-binding transcriptional regulator AlpA